MNRIAEIEKLSLELESKLEELEGIEKIDEYQEGYKTCLVYTLERLNAILET